MPGRQACLRRADDVMAVVAEVWPDAGNLQCAEAGFGGLMTIDMRVPMIPATAETITPPAGALVAVAAIPAEEDRVAVALAVDRQTLSHLEGVIANRFRRTFDPAELTLTLVMQNDGASPMTLRLRNSFYDQHPMPLGTAVDVPPRGRGEMRLSDVATRALLLDGAFAFATFPQ
jgi:hypothetical protein